MSMNTDEPNEPRKIPVVGYTIIVPNRVNYLWWPTRREAAAQLLDAPPGSQLVELRGERTV